MIKYLNFLKTARNEAKLTLQQMAFLLDIDFSTISKYERGEMKSNAFLLISYYLITGKPIYELLHLDDLFVRIGERCAELMAQIDEQPVNEKTKDQISLLENALHRITFLKEQQSAPNNSDDVDLSGVIDPSNYEG